jgi:hypothetical protein
MALLVFFVTNAHHVMLRALVESYDVLPVGPGGLQGDLGGVVAAMLGHVIVLGLKMSLPVMIVLLLVEVALGLLSRVAPSLNLMMLGFPIRVVFALLTLAAILVAVEVLLVSVPTIRLSPKFLEAAAALSTAYLAVEKLLVPQAGQRWLVVAILGVFHGLLFRFFNPESQSGFATGLLAANLLWLGPAALARFLPVKPVAILLALLGTLWFVYRLMF